jgi:hypothetical protein
MASLFVYTSVLKAMKKQLDFQQSNEANTNSTCASQKAVSQTDTTAFAFDLNTFSLSSAPDPPDIASAGQELFNMHMVVMHAKEHVSFNKSPSAEAVMNRSSSSFTPSAKVPHTVLYNIMIDACSKGTF